MTAIDIHFHAVPPLVVDGLRRGDFAEVMEIDASDGRDRLVFHATRGVAIEPDMTLRPAVHDEELILAALDTAQLDAAAVSTPPEFFLYWAPPAIGETIARAFNDGYAQWARARPGRFLPLAAVPLQDPEAATRELFRAIGVLGLRGAAICTHVNGIDLNDPRFAPFFAAAERLNAPLFLHPQNSGDMTRLRPHHLWNLVGFPAETATAVSKMILGGVFERHPNLKVVLAHGGGFFPYQIGRLDHGWEVRNALRENLPRRPSAYLSQIFCDTLVHDEEALRFLVKRIGADHVVIGSDYPFDMGNPRPVEAVTKVRLGADLHDGIVGGNLARLLRVS